MRYWTDTDSERRQRDTDQATADFEKREMAGGLAIRPVRERPSLPADYWEKYNAAMKGDAR